MLNARRLTFFVLLGGIGAGIVVALIWQRFAVRRADFRPVSHPAVLMPVTTLSPFQQAIVQDLDRQKREVLLYRDGYFAGGDPPPNVGVCTDVVIRAFHHAGVDLQHAVAADIRANASVYHILHSDPNIDHRRCRNLARFFQRHALTLPISGANTDWQPGDIVFWDTAGNHKADHVGVIANGRDAEGNPTVVHHWPGCPVAETDGLYRITVRYHFRWKG